MCVRDEALDQEYLFSRIERVGWTSRVVHHDGVQGLGVGVIRPGLVRVYRAVRLTQRHPRVQ